MARGGLELPTFWFVAVGTSSYDTRSIELLGGLVLADIPGRAAAEIGKLLFAQGLDGFDFGGSVSRNERGQQRYYSEQG